MKRSRIIALGGVLAALSVAILYFGGLLSGFVIAAAAVAGLIPAAAVLRGGLRTGCAVYVVTAALALLLLPEKSAALWYAVFFGYYGLLKSLIEQIGRLLAEWPLKLLTYTAAFFVLLLLFRSAFTALTDLVPLGTLPVFFIGMAVFVLYDIGFSRLIGLYLRRIGRNLGKGE
ncbi:MAG: hypothetical protein VB055_07765 [Oscillospiraceae bacterium]|nr:hypothetical protein [Oscillospiraceae bacterium]